jgi:hypothetical protein
MVNSRLKRKTTKRYWIEKNTQYSRRIDETNTTSKVQVDRKQIKSEIDLLVYVKIKMDDQIDAYRSNYLN